MENNGWIFWHLNNKEENIPSKDGPIISIPIADNKSQCTFNMSISPEIKSVSYMSDVNRLNVTIWMSSKLLDNILLKNDIDNENYKFYQVLSTFMASTQIYYGNRYILYI